MRVRIKPDIKKIFYDECIEYEGFENARAVSKHYNPHGLSKLLKLAGEYVEVHQLNKHDNGCYFIEGIHIILGENYFEKKGG